MIYLYPKLSDKDLLLFRLGGAGLGNILFTYARAVVYAETHANVKIIWPTWPSLHIGPIIRNEKDKRFYWDLFKNKTKCISGLKKWWLLLTKKKVKEKEITNYQDLENKIIVFSGFDGCFEPIMNDSQIVLDDIIRNLNKKNLRALNFAEKENVVCMHIRLGDFNRASIDKVLAGQHNTSIPIEWYCKICDELRKICKRDIKIYVFSDGTDEELAPLLTKPNVFRKTFGTAIADILALSRAKVFVASGSSFSMWARYLGRMTAIMFPNQVKQKILSDDEVNKEIITDGNISAEYSALLQSLLQEK